jgi:biotin carboxylase
MRRLTARANLVVPRYRLLRSEHELDGVAEELGFPSVVKPVDNQSGRGVSRVISKAHLSAAFLHAQAFARNGTVLIEAWVEGAEITVDGFVLDGEVSVLGVSRKTPYDDNPTIAARITYPGEFPDQALRRIEDANRRTLDALGLANGVFHAEYVVCGEHVVPIDIAARGGGCMIYTHAVPHISGVHANRAMIEYAMGETVDLARKHGPRAANIEYLRMPLGTVVAIEGIEAAMKYPGVAGLHLNVSTGDRVGDLREKDHRPGYFVAIGNTVADVIATSIAAKSSIRVLMAGCQRFVPVT